MLVNNLCYFIYVLFLSLFLFTYSQREATAGVASLRGVLYVQKLAHTLLDLS